MREGVLFRCSKMGGKHKANFVLGFSCGHENDEYKRIRKNLYPYFVLFCIMEQACKWVSNRHPAGQACKDYNWLNTNFRPSSFSLFVLCSWFVRGSIARIRKKRICSASRLQPAQKWAIGCHVSLPPFWWGRVSRLHQGVIKTVTPFLPCSGNGRNQITVSILLPPNLVWVVFLFSIANRYWASGKG